MFSRRTADIAREDEESDMDDDDDVHREVNVSQCLEDECCFRLIQAPTGGFRCQTGHLS